MLGSIRPITLALALAASACWQPVAQAQNFVVNDTGNQGDSNPGDGVAETALGNGVITLRAALEESNVLAGADTITLPAGTYVLAGSFLTVSSDITLTGAGSATTTISGGGSINPFSIALGGRLVLSKVTLTSGSAFGPGGAVAIGFGGSMDASQCVFSNNTSFFQGGAINCGGTATIRDSQFSNNTAMFGGGAIWNSGIMNLTNCTVSANVVGAFGIGGGILNQGGGEFRADARGLPPPMAVGTAVNCTVTGNVRGGIVVTPGSSMSLQNTLCALNTDGGAGTLDVSGTFTSNGGNLLGDVGLAAGFTDGVNGDQVGGGANPSIDPLLGPLQNNGGPTETHALLSGSRAIDRGLSAGAPATDQRGTARPQGAGIDVGAFESVPPSVDIVDVTPDPCSAAVSSIFIVFSETVVGFDLADLSLKRDGSANLLTGSQTLTTTDNTLFTLGNLAGLTDALGTYTLTLTAASSGITSSLSGYSLAIGATDSWQRVTGNHDPNFDSNITWIPDPAETGTPIQFCVSASDSDGDPLSYVWDFGDGTVGVGQCVMHIFVNPGTYNVTVTVGDGITTVSAAAQVPVGNRFALLSLPVRILLNGVPNKDTYKIKGRLTLPGSFKPEVLLPGSLDPSGRQVTLDVGGVVQTIQLDTRGRGTNADGSFKIKREGRGSWLFTAAFKGGTWSPSWTDNGLVNEDRRRKLVFMPVKLIVQGVDTFTGLKPLQYSARKNASGKTTNSK